MKIVIPGGTGHIGTLVARHLAGTGHEIVIFSRSPGTTAAGRIVAWDGKSPGAWCNELDGADVVINLAGRSVNCRYGARQRREILDSRIHSTRAIGLALTEVRQPPRLWLQASTATIYAHRYDAANDEATGILGGHEPEAPDTWRFSIDVARAWEAAAMEPVLPHTRRVLMRSAITMSPTRSSAFGILLNLVRYGLGGTSGNGRQYVSWIHEQDFVRALDWLITHEELAGPINLAAPHPLPNVEFMQALRRAWGRSVGLPAPAPLLEVAALLMRTESELVLKSRRVVPGVLLKNGFRFSFPDWQQAAEDLCRQWHRRASQNRDTRVIELITSARLSVAPCVQHEPKSRDLRHFCRFGTLLA